MNKHELLMSLRAPLTPRSFRTTERRPKPRHPKHIPPPTQEPHVSSEPNAFKVFSNVLRELRELSPLDRGRVMDAINAELNQSVAHIDPRALQLPTAENRHSGHPSWTMKIGASEPEPETEVIPGGSDMLSVVEAAKIAGVTSVALYGAISRGSVKADKSSGSLKVARGAALAYATHARPRKARGTRADALRRAHVQKFGKKKS